MLHENMGDKLTSLIGRQKSLSIFFPHIEYKNKIRIQFAKVMFVSIFIGALSVAQLLTYILHAL